MEKKQTVKKGAQPQSFAFMMEGISKSFLNGKIKANENITFGAQYGEVVGLIGENGAGKSTLMSILFGLYHPDEGKIIVDGKAVNITSPTVANKYGIGMVPQHFKLVGNMTITENIMLGVETTKFGILNRKAVAEKIRTLSAKYGLDVDPNAKIDSLSIGMKQRVEILKMLFKESKIMVFDEPTSVLTPQEAERLIEIVKQFKNEGKVVIFISHKLNEIIEVSDYIVVMRRGKMTGNIPKKEANPTKLSEMMVGEAVELIFDNKKPFVDATVTDSENVHNVVEFKNVSLVKNGIQKLKNVTFTVAPSEIVGLVGIDGNGQSQVVDLVTRMDKATEGEVTIRVAKTHRHEKHIKKAQAEIFELQNELQAEIKNINSSKELDKKAKEEKIKLVEASFEGRFKSLEDLIAKELEPIEKHLAKNKEKHLTRKDVLMNGVGHIPVDRQNEAIAMDMKVSENMIFNRIDNYSKLGFVNYAKANKFTKEIIEKYDVRGADGGSAIIRGLSGGNQQKAVTGREIEYARKLLVAAHPTRGVDIGAIKNIYKHIIDKANTGTAVIVLSGELDELIAVSHKLVVFSHGEVTGIVDPKKVTKAELGLMMTGTHYDDIKQAVSTIKNKKLVIEKESTKTTEVKSVKKPVAKKAPAKKAEVIKPSTKGVATTKAAPKKQVKPVVKTVKKVAAKPVTKKPVTKAPVAAKPAPKKAVVKKVVTVVTTTTTTETKKVTKPKATAKKVNGGKK